MILKAKERGNAPQLARYLLAMRDNDHVELHEVRGFISDDLVEAFGEADAIARGTRCEKHLFSMSFNPPEDADASIEDFEKAIEQVEDKLGLEGQPHAIVFHEKDGRRHAHAVWSRIDSERMRAINMNHYKIKLRDVSRQLYLKHGWAMPRGLEDRRLRDPLTFTREEWQQAQRAGLDAKELKAVFKTVWEASENRAAFEQALKERGFWLAKGDRRGFVAVDYRGEVYAVARYSGVKAKDVKAKLGDPQELRSVEQVKADIAGGMTAKLQEFIKQAERDAARRSLQNDFRKAEVVGRHQEERRQLTEAHEKRWQAETRKRAERLPKGFSGIWHRLTGRYYAPAMLGSTSAADDLYLGFFKVVGGIAALGGVAGYYDAWRQREKRKASEQPSGIFGEARFATLEDCEGAGMLNPQGLYLGLLDDQPIFHSGKAHLLTCAPARQGKGIGGVFPNLLHYTGSVVVTDPKGELAAVTAAHRRERFGQRVVVLNPWGLHGLPQDRINPLETIIELASYPALQRGLTDEVKATALQLLPEPEDTRNFYFREGSRTILRGALLYLALCEPKLCTLPEAWRIIANPKRLERAVDAMCRSDALGGLLADVGDNLAAQIEGNADQFADFRAGAVQALDIFEPGGYLADAVSFSDVALADLKHGDVSLYLAFPQDRIASHGAALGLIVNKAITAVARSEERGEVLFVLDEFANMGRLAGLAESLTALPGLGVRVWMFVQELAELVRIYGPHTARTLLSQAEVTQFFAVQDFELAKTLSQALGQKTVKTRNYNLGRLATDDIGESLSETGRPLMAADEIRLLARNEQLLLVNGLPPLKAQRVPFWFVAPWAQWAKDNPVAPPYPQETPIVRLSYELDQKTGRKRS